MFDLMATSDSRLVAVNDCKIVADRITDIDTKTGVYPPWGVEPGQIQPVKLTHSVSLTKRADSASAPALSPTIDLFVWQKSVKSTV